MLSSALPRSSRTRTPSGPSAAPIASATAVALVPNVVASSPAATATTGRSARPATISIASPTAASASARLCDTTTIPITGAPIRRAAGS